MTEKSSNEVANDILVKIASKEINSDNMESEVATLHEHIFKAETVEQWIENVQVTFRVQPGDSKKLRMVKEALSHLVLLCTASSSKRRKPIAMRLENELLPYLFFNTYLTPKLIGSVVFKKLWGHFFTFKSGVSEPDSGLVSLFREWQTSYSWNFLPEDGKKDVAGPNRNVSEKENTGHQTPSAPPESKNSSAPVKAGECVSSSFHPQCAPWKSSAPPPKLRSSATTASSSSSSHSIPSYMLTKRRNSGATTAMRPLAESRNTVPWPAESEIDEKSNDSEVILTLESPVKRRRIASILTQVPPSPERPPFRFKTE